jgi:hypothetical protein
MYVAVVYEYDMSGEFEGGRSTVMDVRNVDTIDEAKEKVVAYLIKNVGPIDIDLLSVTEIAFPVIK